MYKLPHFVETDTAKILSFMQNNPFAFIIANSTDSPAASHIPLEVKEKDGKIFLHGHIMKKTDHHIALEKNNNVLVIFTGPHCYVSASWYCNPRSGGTWNYMDVQAKGIISFTDEAGTIAEVRAVTERFEGANSSASFDKLSDEYINAMAKAIVGIIIEVTALDATFKLSQNKDDDTKRRIITRLNQNKDENSRLIANEIEKQLA
jgi:transcriptional regulator